MARIGIIGCGGMANAHRDGLAQMEDVPLVGFCDVVAEAAAAKGAQYGAPHFTDPRRQAG